MIMEINDAIDDCVERLFLMVVVIRMRVLLSANYRCILTTDGMESFTYSEFRGDMGWLWL